METQGTNEWQQGLFGCLGDFRLCIFSFFIPCYVIGKNAEVLGEDCMLIGLLAAIGLQFGSVLRWRIRQQKNIKGSMMMDALMWTCVPCCALAQEARELGWNAGNEGAPKGDDMNRT